MSYVLVLHSTINKVQLRRMASQLGIPRACALGLCAAVWVIADQDGTLDAETDQAVLQWTVEELDAELGVPGTCKAMMAVGWMLEREDGTLALPNFCRYNGAGGKAAVRHKSRNERASERRRASAYERPGASPRPDPEGTMSLRAFLAKNPDAAPSWMRQA